jgi:hypothetical protein
MASVGIFRPVEFFFFLSLFGFLSIAFLLHGTVGSHGSLKRPSSNSQDGVSTSPTGTGKRIHKVSGRRMCFMRTPLAHGEVPSTRMGDSAPRMGLPAVLGRHFRHP